MTLKELEPHLSALSRAEKAEVVQRLALDLANAWPGIEKTPGVVGGAACIVRTRSAFRCGRWKTIAVWAGVKPVCWRITLPCVPPIW